MTKCGHDILYSQMLAAILLECMIATLPIFYKSATVSIKMENEFSLEESKQIFKLLPALSHLH